MIKIERKHLSTPPNFIKISGMRVKLYHKYEYEGYCQIIQLEQSLPSVPGQQQYLHVQEEVSSR